MSRSFLKRLLIFAGLLCMLPTSALAGAKQPEEIMVPRIDVEKAHQQYRQDQIIFLDARSTPDWNTSEVKLPEARRVLTEAEIERFAREVGKDQPIIIYCT